MGHEVYDFRGTELEGAGDSVVIEEALRLGAVILTTDRDFFHTLHQHYPNHAGLAVIALRQPSRSAILHRLK